MAREIAWLANILHVQSFRVLTIVYFVIVFVLSLVAEAFAVGKGYTRLAQMNRFRLKVVEFDCIDFMLSPSCCDREISPRENMEPWFNLVLDHTSRHQAADFIVSLARLVRLREPFLWLTLDDDSGSCKNGTTMILSRVAKYKQK
ncbi:Hypothetical predicted protein [Prunus dulcis]|uniref:Uncharacterized protein n=1 Tax=Prunus dulcis TaxID=3755 RepID=A0A5E4GD55_PRUDU|nr:hypothetical protein L3X38_024989 [Prunus dulcis]VVA37560.1 Hypothetical predicted protein [Prunus dulcis]